MSAATSNWIDWNGNTTAWHHTFILPEINGKSNPSTMDILPSMTPRLGNIFISLYGRVDWSIDIAILFKLLQIKEGTNCFYPQTQAFGWRLLATEPAWRRCIIFGTNISCIFHFWHSTICNRGSCPWSILGTGRVELEWYDRAFPAPSM